MSPREEPDLTRPIIGIENRSALEVFDIMSDRIRGLLSRPPVKAASPEREAVAWGLFNPYTGQLRSATYRDVSTAKAQAEKLTNNYTLLVAVPLFFAAPPATERAEVVADLRQVDSEALGDVSSLIAARCSALPGKLIDCPVCGAVDRERARLASATPRAPSEAPAIGEGRTVARAAEFKEIAAFHARKASDNVDEAERFDAEAADWANHEDPMKRSRERNSRICAEHCRQAAEMHQAWVAVLAAAPTPDSQGEEL